MALSREKKISERILTHKGKLKCCDKMDKPVGRIIRNLFPQTTLQKPILLWAKPRVGARVASESICSYLRYWGLEVEREIFIFKVRDAYAQSPISPTMFECYDPAIHKTVIVYSFIRDNDFELLSPLTCGRWLAWMPHLSGHQISSRSPLMSLITQGPLPCRPLLIYFSPLGLPMG